MQLKDVKQFVKYLNQSGVLEIIDTQSDGDSMFGKDYKVDSSQNFFVGKKNYGVVNSYTYIGKLVKESNTLFLTELNTNGDKYTAIKWLWAINRGKVKEYYANNYGCGSFKFNNSIGGSIVETFLQKNSELLKLAYTYLSFEWNSILQENYELPRGKLFDTRQNLNFKEFSWLLFSSLAFRLDGDTITKVFDIPYKTWDTIWHHLDQIYFPENFDLES